MGPANIFSEATSVVLFGESRPLLNWVAYAVATVTDPEFIWTDVRMPGQLVSESDPLSRGLIPTGRMNVMHPDELALNNASANVAISLVIRPDEPPNEIRRLLDFLRLPTQAQEVLSAPRPEGRPRVVVLSNGHRMMAFFPSPSSVAQTVRAMVDSGVIMIMTIADAPAEGRFAFETVLHLEGNDPKGWRDAVLRVEKGPASGPLRTGSTHRLGDVDPVATVLAKALG